MFYYLFLLKAVLKSTNKMVYKLLTSTLYIAFCAKIGVTLVLSRERGGLVAEPRTPEREVGGSTPTSAVLCP